MFRANTGINELCTLSKHISCKCKLNLMETNVIQINDIITIYVDQSVKKIVYVKKIIFGIMLYVVAKMVKI